MIAGTKRLLAIIAAVVATASAAGVTIHRSFRGGYPAAVLSGCGEKGDTAAVVREEPSLGLLVSLYNRAFSPFAQE